MLDVSSMTADQILAVKEPEFIFPFSIDEAKNLYRRLAGRWHPDRGGDDSVFAHLKDLHERAEQKIAMGFWCGPSSLHFRTRKGSEFALSHNLQRAIDIGWMFIGDRFMTYAVKNEFADLAEEFVKTSIAFQYKSKAMQDEIQRYLPKVHDCHETLEYTVLVIDKTPDLFSLRDVAQAMGGKVPAEHVAWIVSSMLNLLCYLHLIGKRVHGDISLDSYFVSPKEHVGALLGGWFYSGQLDKPPRALPARTINLIPEVKRERRLTRAIDSALVKATALELLGDINGSKLLTDKSIPRPMFNWLRSTTTPKTAIEEYTEWKESVLPKSFGKPKFVELALTKRDIYKEK